MKEEAKEVLNELLVDVFNHILDIERHQLKESGVELSITEVHVIEAISLVEECTMSAIAKKLRITLGTLSISMDKIIKKGYAYRFYDENDRRKVLIGLTSEGQTVLLKHKYFHDEMLDNLLLDTTLFEDEVLIKSLQNIKNYFKIKY